MKVTSSNVALPTRDAVVPFDKFVFTKEFSEESGGALKDVEPTKEELTECKLVMGVQQGEWCGVLHNMYNARMCVFQDQEPKCINGCFGVTKPDGKVRLIIDLRRGNLYFKGTTELKLMNPAYLVELILEGDKVFLGKTDISNFFHVVQVPAWLSQYFGLPRVWSQDVGVSGTPRWIWPVMQSLPMGFIRSVNIAQALHDHFVEAALPATCETITADLYDFHVKRNKI